MPAPTPRSLLADASATEIATTRKVSLAALLDGHLHPALTHITCALTGSNVTLEGEVPTFYIKQLAQETATHIRGVQSVDNKICVRPTAVGGR